MLWNFTYARRPKHRLLRKNTENGGGGKGKTTASRGTWRQRGATHIARIFTRIVVGTLRGNTLRVRHTSRYAVGPKEGLEEFLQTLRQEGLARNLAPTRRCTSPRRGETLIRGLRILASSLAPRPLTSQAQISFTSRRFSRRDDGSQSIRPFRLFRPECIRADADY